MSPVTRALARKDLRELLPWAVLCALLGLLDVATELLEQPDNRPLGVTISSLHGGIQGFMWLLAFALGTGLGAREHDEGTLAFLDGLPVSRARVFVVKLAVAFGMVLMLPTVSLSLITLLHALSRGSLNASFEPQVLLACYALHAGLIAQGVIVGAAVGFLRSLTWLVTGALATGLAVLTDRASRYAFLSPFSLVDTELTPRGPAVDALTLAVQLGLTFVLGLVAVALFVRGGRRSSLDLSNSPWLRALVGVVSAAALVAAFTLWAKRLGGDDDDEDADVPTDERFALDGEPPASDVPAQTVTKHYRISYPSTQATLALELAAQADATFEQVHALLHVPLTGSIDVDASGSMQNTEGTAFFGRLRVRLGGGARSTLAHETAHVLAQRLVGGERDGPWEGALTLNEGIATWVEHNLPAAPEAGAERAADAGAVAGADAGAEPVDPRAGSRVLLAALFARRELSLEELADSTLLEMRRDGNLKYPAGEALIATFVSLYGEAAIAKLLPAFSDRKLPSDLSGLALWEAVFQRAGFDLGRVIDELLRDIASDAAAHAETIAALPRPRVRIVEDEAGLLGIQGLLDAEPTSREPVLIHLRFKPSPTSGLDDYEHTRVSDGMASFRDPDDVQNGRICVQPGVLVSHQVLYEAWVCLPTSDAVPFVPPPSTD